MKTRTATRVRAPERRITAPVAEPPRPVDRRHVLLSSGSMLWRTPRDFLGLVRCIRPIGTDPASAPDNPTGALHFFDGRDPDRDGLCNPWPAVPGHLNFINPPYGAHLSGEVDPSAPVIQKGEIVGYGRGWGKRIAAETHESVALVPVRTETDWWGDLCDWCDWMLFWSSPWFGRRVQFVDAATGHVAGGSTLASTVFYRGPDPARFVEVFGPHGRLMPGSRQLHRLARCSSFAGRVRFEAPDFTGRRELVEVLRAAA